VTIRALLDTAMTEAQFQDTVIELAQRMGWRVAHFRPARTDKGWRTPVSADGKGFPDLVLIRGGFIIFAELKSSSGKLTIDQRLWLMDLRKAQQGAPFSVSVRVWRPGDWDEIERALTNNEGKRP